MKVLFGLVFFCSLFGSSLRVFSKEKEKEKEKGKASDFTEVLSADEASNGEASPEALNTDGESSADETALKDSEALRSGQVRVMRKIERTEVFFKDLKESFFIPSGSAYSRLYKAFEQSQKTGSAVHFKVNTKTRQILSLEKAPPAKTAPGAEGEASSKGGAGSQ